jgi:hypothetical protein
MIAASSLLFESADTILRIARSQRDSIAVFYPAIEVSRIARNLAHLCNATEITTPIYTRRYTVDFEVFQSVLVFFHTNRLGSVFFLAIQLPALGRFQDMTVSVYRARPFAASSWQMWEAVNPRNIP